MRFNPCDYLPQINGPGMELEESCSHPVSLDRPVVVHPQVLVVIGDCLERRLKVYEEFG
jgi:hypothetical protein